LYDGGQKDYLTIKEASYLLRDIIQLGATANFEVIEQLVHNIDVNGDNQISKDEFSELLLEHFL